MLVGDASAIETRDVLTSDSRLNSHGTLEFHGEGRTEYEYCVTCHTAGAEDRYSSTDPGVAPGVPIEFAVLIHKMHNGANLSQNYDIAGNSYTSSYEISNFNHVSFPRPDGDTAACAACHEGNEANEDPNARSCLSCHDATDAAAHAALNTDETYGEACDVCHGPGRDFAVGTLHDWLR
jgi:OmcA/MtrC family decaheme c-type cytochrome